MIVYNSMEIRTIQFDFIWNFSDFIKHLYLIRVLSSHQSLKITWNSIDFYSSRFHQVRKTTVLIVSYEDSGIVFAMLLDILASCKISEKPKKHYSSFLSIRLENFIEI